MTTRRARTTRWLVRHTPAAVLEWPFESFCAASGVVAFILSATLSSLVPPVVEPVLSDTWAPVWAWTVIASSLIIVWGLRKDDLRSVATGLHISGLLYGSYVVAATIDSDGPMTVLGAATVSVMTIACLLRGTYLNATLRYYSRQEE